MHGVNLSTKMYFVTLRDGELTSVCCCCCCFVLAKSPYVVVPERQISLTSFIMKIDKTYNANSIIPFTHLPNSLGL